MPDAIPPPPALPEAPPTDHLLPPGGSKVDRIALHTKGLVDDVKTWVELKMKLTQLEIEERLDAKVNAMVIGLAVAGVGLLALVFALITLALGLGAWLGHPAWGFLVVTVLLLLVAGALRALHPHLVNVGSKRARIDPEKVHP